MKAAIVWRKPYQGRVLHAVKVGQDAALCGARPAGSYLGRWWPAKENDPRKRCSACTANAKNGGAA